VEQPNNIQKQEEYITITPKYRTGNKTIIMIIIKLTMTTIIKIIQNNNNNNNNNENNNKMKWNEIIIKH